MRVCRPRRLDCTCTSPNVALRASCAVERDARCPLLTRAGLNIMRLNAQPAVCATENLRKLEIANATFMRRRGRSRSASI